MESTVQVRAVGVIVAPGGGEEEGETLKEMFKGEDNSKREEGRESCERVRVPHPPLTGLFSQGSRPNPLLSDSVTTIEGLPHWSVSLSPEDGGTGRVSEKVAARKG